MKESSRTIQLTTRRLRLFFAACALAGLWALSARAADVKPTDTKPAAVEPSADKLLKRMGDYLAQAPFYSVNAEVWQDVQLGSGQQIQVGRTIDLQVRRPDRFHAEVHSTRRNRELFYDGKSITLFNRVQNFYGNIPAPATLDQALDTASERFGIAMPLEDLVVSDPYQSAMQKIVSGRDLGPVTVPGHSLRTSCLLPRRRRLADLDRGWRQPHPAQNRHHLQRRGRHAGVHGDFLPLGFSNEIAGFPLHLRAASRGLQDRGERDQSRKPKAQQRGQITMRFANTVSTGKIVVGIAALLVALPLLYAQQHQQSSQRAEPGPRSESAPRSEPARAPVQRSQPAVVDRVNHGSIRHLDTHAVQRPVQVTHGFDSHGTHGFDSHHDVFVHHDVDADIHRPRFWHNFRFGARFDVLPVGYVLLMVNGSPYYYDDGLYYQQADNGYQEVYPRSARMSRNRPMAHSSSKPETRRTIIPVAHSMCSRTTAMSSRRRRSALPFPNSLPEPCRWPSTAAPRTNSTEYITAPNSSMV